MVFHGRAVNGLKALLAKLHVLAMSGLGGFTIVDVMVSSLLVVSGLAEMGQSWI